MVIVSIGFIPNTDIFSAPDNISRIVPDGR